MPATLATHPSEPHDRNDQRTERLQVSSCCAFIEGESICRRGGRPDTGGGIDLALPADSTTTVFYGVRVAAPPWPAPGCSPITTATSP
jgi:hypothetical protein